MKNDHLTKYHIENALKSLENAPKDWINNEEKERMLKDMKEEVKRIGIRL